MHPTKQEIWLCVELTSRSGSLALQAFSGSFPTLLGERLVTAEGNHSEKLIPELKKLLESVGLALPQVDRFVCASGPGSFTGLRVAMASLKAFAYALNRPIDTVSGSEAKAVGWLTETKTPLAKDDAIVVLTSVSQRKHTQALYRVTENGKLHSEGESVAEKGTPPPMWQTGHLFVIGDAQLAGLTPNPKMTAYPDFALSARHLGLAAYQGESRTTWKDLPQWVALSPIYFGTSVGEKKTTGDVEKP